jgi:hypothetical protein
MTSARCAILPFPLIEPPYDRIRWDAVVYEYGQKREFRRDCGHSIRLPTTRI